MNIDTWRLWNKILEITFPKDRNVNLSYAYFIFIFILRKLNASVAELKAQITTRIAAVIPRRASYASRAGGAPRLVVVSLLNIYLYNGIKSVKAL